jgi:hypothetical protein
MSRLASDADRGERSSSLRATGASFEDPQHRLDHKGVHITTYYFQAVLSHLIVDTERVCEAVRWRSVSDMACT